MVRLPIQLPGIRPFFPTKSDSNLLRPEFLSPRHELLTLLHLASTHSHLAQIHARIHSSGLLPDPHVATQLLKASSLSIPSHQNLSYARQILRHSCLSKPTAWNIVIRGCSAVELHEDALDMYAQMRRGGVSPNEHTLPFVMKSCGELSALRKGKQVHCEVVKCGLDWNVYVMNCLVFFYGSCGRVGFACKVFDGMSERSVVSWNSVMTACVDNMRLDYGIGYFARMRNAGFDPDETTMVVALCTCTELGNLSLGKWVHSQVIGRGMALNCKLGTALVDMYAKCGEVQFAKFVFDRLDEKNVWTWSSMILGLAQHGYADEGLHLFSEMKEDDSIRPNYVTFLGVLCACSHAGLVHEGYRYFDDMQRVHGIEPTVLHYGAMVDTLSRAGRLMEAYDFITRMPVKPDPALWRTLLSACRVHNQNDDVGVGDLVRRKLLELEPCRGGNLVMAANMFADAGMWDAAASLRRDMRNRRVKTRAGESCIDVCGSTHKFYAGDDNGPKYKHVYEWLVSLSLHSKMLDEV
ncbi:hypothetical protein MLD38_024505 [Melastoma candidum]|uniref:Uncharacterized protein n=2 Tax=Melastoma candidum TaxID=119954 RepID=A0ACB9NSI0_9MYRT|nr:hypothetical protein MLD38_024505 [Melastoma candidum]